jgi:hypothetical protein
MIRSHSEDRYFWTLEFVNFCGIFSGAMRTTAKAEGDLDTFSFAVWRPTPSTSAIRKPAHQKHGSLLPPNFPRENALSQLAGERMYAMGYLKTY